MLILLTDYLKQHNFVTFVSIMTKLSTTA